jgi:hypothetical protein
VSARHRKYAGLVAMLVLLFVYSRFARPWSDVEYYAGAAALEIALLPIALLWIEMAPDGQLRRRQDA